MITKEKALEILQRFDFFQGQRAGRELWKDKPFDVQEEDLRTFARDCLLLKEYIELTAQREGEWEAVINSYGLFIESCYICSSCKCEFDGAELPAANYCPNCGAKMKGGE